MFLSVRHNPLDLYYLSQSYFGLPKGTKRIISNKKFLFNQTLKDIENKYRDVVGYDMKYGEFKRLCRKTWEGEYNHYSLIDLEREIKEDTVYVMKAKTHILNANLKRNLFH